MKKQKYYVVWKGHKPGIYQSWEECNAQIFGFIGALYKSFPDLRSAEKAYSEKPHLHFQKQKKTAGAYISGGIILDSISVDGACNTVTGDMEYRGVYTKTGEEWFRRGPFPDATNNIGEFLAIVHALALLKKTNNKMPVYSDSHTALVWIKNKRAKTKLVKTDRNDEIFDLIRRAEHWLEKNTFENPLIKWVTSAWGEIPADFGRK